MARIYLSKDNCKITQTDLYLVKLELSDGTVHENLEPKRLFPHTDLDHYIAIIDEDEKEIAMIKDISDLEKDSKKAILDCFESIYMIPKITAIVNVQDKFGALKIIASTDRGDVEFRIRNRHSDIKMMRRTHRVLIRDANDNRYEIPDFSAMDKRSQKLLFSYI